MVSVFEAHASAVRVRIGHPILTDQEPMASRYGRPDFQIVQSAAGSQVVFNVNQFGWTAIRQVSPRRHDRIFKYLPKTLILTELHDSTALRNRSSRSTADRCHIAP